MRSLIYGCGSLGTVLGALLAEAGEDVLLVSRNREHIQALKSCGASIEGSLQKTVPVHAALPEEISGTFDGIFLMTKQLDNQQSMRALAPFLTAEGAVCCLQNGIPELALRGLLPDERILGGVVPWSASYQRPGVSRLTSPADSVRFTIGAPFAGSPVCLERIKGVLEKAGKVEIDGDILSMRWSKLLVNASVSALSSSLGLPCGGVTHDRRLQPLVLRLLKECIDVGRAQGVVFRSVNDYPIAEELYVSTDAELISAQEKLPIAFRSIKDSDSSILQDLRRGRRTEIQAISGIVCRSGRACGIPTPFHDCVVRVIEKIEAGELPCDPSNFREYEELLNLPADQQKTPS